MRIYFLYWIFFSFSVQGQTIPTRNGVISAQIEIPPLKPCDQCFYDQKYLPSFIEYYDDNTLFVASQLVEKDDGGDFYQTISNQEGQIIKLDRNDLSFIDSVSDIPEDSTYPCGFAGKALYSYVNGLNLFCFDNSNPVKKATLGTTTFLLTLDPDNLEFQNPPIDVEDEIMGAVHDKTRRLSFYINQGDSNELIAVTINWNDFTNQTQIFHDIFWFGVQEIQIDTVSRNIWAIGFGYLARLRYEENGTINVNESTITFFYFEEGQPLTYFARDNFLFGGLVYSPGKRGLSGIPPKIFWKAAIINNTFEVVEKFIFNEFPDISELQLSTYGYMRLFYNGGVTLPGSQKVAWVFSKKPTPRMSLFLLAPRLTRLEDIFLPTSIEDVGGLYYEPKSHAINIVGFSQPNITSIYRLNLPCESSVSCPFLLSCPSDRPKKCGKGICVQNNEACPPFTCPPQQTACPSGVCVASSTGCPPFNGCPINRIPCPDKSTCVTSLSECPTCSNGGFLCNNGQCVTTEECPTPPALIKPRPTFVSITSDNSTTIELETEEGEVIFMIDIPPSTFCQNANLSILPVEDSILRGLKGESWKEGDEIKNLFSPVFQIFSDCEGNSINAPIVFTTTISSDVDVQTLCLISNQEESNIWEPVDCDLQIISEQNGQITLSGITNHFTTFSIGVNPEKKKDDTIEIHAGIVIAIALLLLIIIGALAGTTCYLYKKNKKQDKFILQVPLADANDPKYQPLRAFLEELQLMQYFPLFVNKEIDFETLETFNEAHLVEIGVQVGAAKKIMNALNAMQTNTYLNPKEIKVGRRLGGGAFGEVFEGMWQSTRVALKRLHDEGQIEEFTAEFKLLQKLRHPNIVFFYGIYKDPANNDQYMVTELLPLGNLKDLLRNQASSFTLPDLIHVAKLAAAGMTYLFNNNIIHNDLAARNLLVKKEDNKYTVKVGDFGLSKHTKDKTYEADKDSKFPVKWTAPEAFTGKFSSKSDVWSFGIVLYEIITYGEDPYSDMKNKEVFEKVQQGYRMPQPSGCPVSLYKLMLSCWDANPENRPDFPGIYELLSVIQQDEVGESQVLDDQQPKKDKQTKTSTETKQQENIYNFTPKDNVEKKPFTPYDSSKELSDVENPKPKMRYSSNSLLEESDEEKEN